MPKKNDVIDLRNQRFGELVVLKQVRGEPTTTWLCRCDCGRRKAIRAAYLRRGTVLSCGCRRRRVAAERHATHGLTRRGQQHPEYHRWSNIKQRCTNPSNPSYKNYGGRGIQMCERWRDSFPAFLEDMGPRPSPKHTVERLDNLRGYEPSNCRWATRHEQGGNKRNNLLITLDGETHHLMEWARRTGINWRTIRERLRRGWSAESALTVRPG